MKKYTLYLGGPMLTIPDFGFQAFDEAEIELLGFPHVVRSIFNPARRDREAGLKVEGMRGTEAELERIGFSRREALSADMAWIGEHSEGMVCLPGWRDSYGTKAEAAFHQALHLPVWDLADFILPARHHMDPARFQLADMIPPAVCAYRE
jgi:hypothetical protein